MNRFLIIAASALAAASCASDSPLFVTGFFPIDPNNEGACELTPGDVSQYAGSLDLSGSPSYQLIATLRSELDATLDTKGDTVTLVSGRHRNTVILDTVNFTYTSAPTATVANVSFEPETVPITIVLAPAAESNVRMGLLGPKAFEALSKAVANPGESSQLTVKFQFSGQIISGGVIKSTPITFPITVYRSGFVCSAGQRFCATAACGNIGGQDGAPLVCSTPAADGGTDCPVKQ